MDHQAWLEGAKKRFDFDNWPRLQSVASDRRTRGFALDIRDAAGSWIWERQLPYSDGGYAVYFEGAADPAHRMMVRVTEYYSHENALQGLLELLSTVMAPTLPRLEAGLRAIGDVAFRGLGETVTILFFVRHNVLIDIRSIGDDPVSVLPLAGIIDDHIIAAVA